VRGGGSAATPETTARVFLAAATITIVNATLANVMICSYKDFEEQLQPEQRFFCKNYKYYRRGTHRVHVMHSRGRDCMDYSRRFPRMGDHSPSPQTQRDHCASRRPEGGVLPAGVFIFAYERTALFRSLEQPGAAGPPVARSSKQFFN